MVDGYPLYYEATNEKGVSAAGLMFAENAYYPGMAEGKDNIPPFEFIPWLLAQCGNMQEVRKLLERINLVNISFSEELPLTPMHWMISYKEESLVVESMEDGLHVYENPVDVLTNNPPFPMQLWNLNNYMGLSGEKQENRFAKGLPLKGYSRGMGALGLPGDLSSPTKHGGLFRLHQEAPQSPPTSLYQAEQSAGFLLRYDIRVYPKREKPERVTKSECRVVKR